MNVTNVAFEPYAYQPIDIHRVNNAAFRFDSVYLTSAWDQSQSVTLTGYNSQGQTVGTTTVTVSNITPTFVSANWGQITDLQITNTQLIGPTGLSGSGDQLVLDNFVFSEDSPLQAVVAELTQIYDSLLHQTQPPTAGIVAELTQILDSILQQTQPPTAPPVLVAHSATVHEGSTFTAAAPGVLANDTDPNYYGLTVSDVSSSDGHSALAGNSVTGLYGTLTLDADGSYKYIETSTNIPSGGVQDDFNYTVSDGHGGSSPSTLDISILPGTLAYYVEKAETLINAQMLNDPTATHLTNDFALVHDIVTQLHVGGYSFNEGVIDGVATTGFINLTPTEPLEYLNQCAIFVNALDPKTEVGTPNWHANVNDRVDLSGVDSIAGFNNFNMKTGMAIATFTNVTTQNDTGVYGPPPGPRESEHAAIFLGYGTEPDGTKAGQVAGFFVLDQYDTDLTNLHPKSDTQHYEPAEVRFIGFSDPAAPYYYTIHQSLLG